MTILQRNVFNTFIYNNVVMWNKKIVIEKKKKNSKNNVMLIHAKVEGRRSLSRYIWFHWKTKKKKRIKKSKTKIYENVQKG